MRQISERREKLVFTMIPELKATIVVPVISTP
jgi:hypothetical protein